MADFKQGDVVCLNSDLRNKVTTNLWNNLEKREK